MDLQQLFSQVLLITATYLISSPLEMRYVRQRDYMKKVGNYKDMSPYYNIELVDNVGPRPFGFPTERYYVEIDKENPKQRYKYRRFEKGADRHFFNTKPKQIKCVRLQVYSQKK